MLQPLCALPLLRVAASGAPPQGLPPHGGGACATDWDCALGGTCAGSKCQCDAWFTGHNCTLLNLAPARHGNGFDLSGLSSGGDSFHGPRWTGWSSWGGHAVRDDNSSGWVGVFSLMARGCGLHDYHSNSESVIATAPEVDGPYTLVDPTNPDAPGNIAVPAPSHCTQVKQHPSGAYHLWHIFPGAADNASSPDAGPPELSCTNGTRLRAPPPPPPKPCPATGCIPPKNQQLFVHTAPTPRGPWSAHGTPIHLETLNETTISQSSCSAPFYHPNGSVTLVVGGAACPQGWGGSGGAHGGGGGCLWEFFAESWQGPYRQVARPTGNAGDPITHPENEDPAVFTDPRGNYHMLTNVNTGHRRCGSGTACGGHAWSRTGVSWSDTFVGAFGPNGKMANGSNYSLGYVERPQIAQEAPGKAPLALFLSAGPKYLAGATFTWAQRFCDAEALAAGQCGFMGGVPWDGPQPKPPDAATPPPSLSTGEAAPTCSNWTSGMDVDCCNIAQSGPHTQAECCAMCHANPKCAAVVWNAGS